MNDQEGSGDSVWMSWLSWGGRSEGRTNRDCIGELVHRLHTFDPAGGDHEAADGIYQHRTILRTDKAQSLHRDAGSRSIDIERNRSRLNTRHLTVLVPRPRDRDSLRYPDRGQRETGQFREYRGGPLKREMPLHDDVAALIDGRLHRWNVSIR